VFAVAIGKSGTEEIIPISDFPIYKLPQKEPSMHFYILGSETGSRIFLI